jgi:hypothetical protein
MLFADPSYRTERLTDATALRLRESDGVARYQDCGWHCATGYKDGQIHVMVRANSRAELDDALGTPGGPRPRPGHEGRGTIQ